MTRIEITDSNENRTVGVDHQITVRSLLSESSLNEVVDVINRVSALPVDSIGCLAFPIVWRRLARPQSVNIVRAVLLAKNLERYLDELNVNEGVIICDSSVDDLYAYAVEDVAANTSLDFQREEKLRDHLPTFLTLISVLAKIILLFADWAIGRVVGAFRDEKKTNILYIPALERLGSSQPVADALEDPPAAIVTDPTSYYYTRRDRSQLRQYNVMTIHEVLPTREFLRQFYDIATIVREIVSQGPFTMSVSTAIDEEFGIALPRAVKYQLRQTIIDFRLLRALLLRRSFRALFAEGSSDSVIFGTLDPLGRAISREAIAADIAAYHIPHSIATTHPPNPEPSVTQFVSGKMDVSYYERAVPPEQQWNWIPLGRPYLSDLAEKYRDRERHSLNDETIRAVVAPPTSPWWVREAFIKDVLDSFDDSRFKTTVKPHPDDNEAFYRDIASDYENVCVVTEGLYDEIQTADLTVTLNSNVGLESIVVGTPTLCYNAWKPLTLEQTYAFADEIPVIESCDELAAWTDEHDAESLASLGTSQRRFVEENYRLEPTVVDDIAQYIEKGDILDN